MIVTSLDRYQDAGLLILRVGIGAAFMLHGAPKLLGGPARWAQVGAATSNLGVTLWPSFWGLLAGLAEFGGGLLLMLGLFSRTACFLLFCTMAVATVRHFARGDGFGGASHALEAAILFFSLIFIGPGAYSIDERLRRKRRGANVGW